MTIRGIRGATTINKDTQEGVLMATRELLETILVSNTSLEPKGIASVIFTVTDDITSAFPALAARQMGWTHVPMICTREIPVPGSIPLCIRVLIHWNTEIEQELIKPVYLHAAQNLRPDLSQS